MPHVGNRYLTLEQANTAIEVLTPILGRVNYNDLTGWGNGKGKWKATGRRSLKWQRIFKVIHEAAAAMDNLGLGYYIADRNIGSFRIIVPKEFSLHKKYQEMVNLQDMLDEARERSVAAFDEHAPEFMRKIFDGIQEARP